MRRFGEAGATPLSGGSRTGARLSAASALPLPSRSRDGGRSPISEQPTQARPARAGSPPEPAVGRDAVRRYEAALARLRPRDQQAVRGRIEIQQSYGTLAESLGVANAAAARAVVTRALGRLVEEMGA